MNIETPIAGASEAKPPKFLNLLDMGSPALTACLSKAEGLRKALGELADIGDEKTAETAMLLQRHLDAVEPSVTMIGQVKAGKTSLVNAMAGWPNLLPADVNPWTSVVTSLHLNPQIDENDKKAKFRFFDRTEWNRLLDKGGRIGELARRAGADDELEVIAQQIETMREKSRARLGKKFEMLLGQEHDYGYFDKDLIERYVCLGDDFDDDDSTVDTQGRFADITKAADLFVHRPEFPMPLCIRDTPGVNDTFMMREQITIRAIRDSRICVVVLSAHQALSAVDLAIIRMISNIKSREVIIFVNRIDELPDPAKQVPEIRDSIQKTLEKHQGPTDAQIIFGSAYWANNALSGSLDDISQDSALSLCNWAEEELQRLPTAQSPEQIIWELSGVPALFRALSDRVAEGVAKEAVDKVARSAINLANGVQVANQIVSSQVDIGAIATVDRQDLVARLDRIEAQQTEALQSQFTALTEDFAGRVDRSHRSFLERATGSLISHLERYGENSVWEYNPMGLRVLLRSSYQIFGKRSQTMAQKLYDATAVEIAGVYAAAFGASAADFNIEAPQSHRVPPPVFLGQTIALDLQGSWWKSWWQRRRGYKAFAAGFYKMIMEETDPIVTELKDNQANAICAEADAVLHEFLKDQRAILMGIAEQAEKGGSDLDDILGVREGADRKKVVETTITTLTQYVA